MMKSKEKHNAKLLVEGKDDLHIIIALCQKCCIEENFDLIDCEGRNNLLEQIAVRFKQSGIQTVGIVIDADTDTNATWQELKARLKNSGFTQLPNQLPQQGFIHSENGLKTGIWVMPDNNSKGMIEDFMIRLIPKNDVLLPIAETVLDDIEQRNVHKYKSIHRAKAKIHTWLAWQEEPGNPFGLAIKKGNLNTNDTICQSFVDWIRNLFA